jgi:hypothetical protein
MKLKKYILIKKFTKVKKIAIKKMRTKFKKLKNHIGKI